MISMTHGSKSAWYNNVWGQCGSAEFYVDIRTSLKLNEAKGSFRFPTGASELDRVPQGSVELGEARWNREEVEGTRCCSVEICKLQWSIFDLPKMLRLCWKSLNREVQLKKILVLETILTLDNFDRNYPNLWRNHQIWSNWTEYTETWSESPKIRLSKVPFRENKAI